MKSKREWICTYCENPPLGLPIFIVIKDANKRILIIKDAFFKNPEVPIEDVFAIMKKIMPTLTVVTKIEYD